MLMLAGGGESCADIEHLRVRHRLFGEVCSDTTIYRTITKITPTVLTAENTAAAAVRHDMWHRMAATTGMSPVMLDIDASPIEIYSENDDGTGP